MLSLESLRPLIAFISQTSFSSGSYSPQTCELVILLLLLQAPEFLSAVAYKLLSVKCLFSQWLS